MYLLPGASGIPRLSDESTGPTAHPFTGPPNSSNVARQVLLPTSHSFAVPSFDTETIFLPRSIILVSVTPVREKCVANRTEIYPILVPKSICHEI